MNTRYIVCGIVQKEGKVALGKKAKGVPPYPDVWHTPGGGADDIETASKLYEEGDFNNVFFQDELKREMREELGVEISNIQNIVPKYRNEPRQDESVNKHGEMTHYYFLEYLCDYAGGELKPADDLAEAEWVDKNELKNYSLTPPSMAMYQELGWL